MTKFDVRCWVKILDSEEAPNEFPLEVGVTVPYGGPKLHFYQKKYSYAYSETMDEVNEANMIEVYNTISSDYDFEPIIMSYDNIEKIIGTFYKKDNDSLLALQSIEQSFSDNAPSIEPLPNNVPSGQFFRFTIAYSNVQKGTKLHVTMVADHERHQEDPNLTLDLFREIIDNKDAMKATRDVFKRVFAKTTKEENNISPPPINKVEITVQRSLQEVWEFFTIPSNWDKWWGGTLTKVEPGWQNGAKLIWALGRPTTILNIIPQKKIEFESTWAKGVWTFTATNSNSTQLTFEEKHVKGATIDPKKWQDEKSSVLLKFKQCVESESPSPEKKDMSASIDEQYTSMVSQAETKGFSWPDALAQMNDTSADHTEQVTGLTILHNTLLADFEFLSNDVAYDLVNISSKIEGLCQALRSHSNVAIRRVTSIHLGTAHQEITNKVVNNRNENKEELLLVAKHIRSELERAAKTDEDRSVRRLIFGTLEWHDNPFPRWQIWKIFEVSRKFRKFDSNYGK